MKWKENFRVWSIKFDFLRRSQWKSEIEVIEENCIFEVAIEMNFAMEVSNGVRMRETTAIKGQTWNKMCSSKYEM